MVSGSKKKAQSRNKARQKFLPLESPVEAPTNDLPNREEWISKICSGFVSTSKANKEYYRVVIELLWPVGHGIPGPYVVQSQLRDAIDNFRRAKLPPNTPYKPYVDVFRRVRELQGEEGLIGVAREGHTFQLVDLNLGNKRIPRTKLEDKAWERVLEKYGHSCPVCGRQEPEIRFDQDHKTPRVRGGGDEESNWMPLCGECNNFKSTACRGCKLDCSKCCWAFPEKYAPLNIKPEYIEKIRHEAIIKGTTPDELFNKLLEDGMRYQTNKKIDN